MCVYYVCICVSEHLNGALIHIYTLHFNNDIQSYINKLSAVGNVSLDSLIATRVPYINNIINLDTYWIMHNDEEVKGSRSS